MVGIATRPKQEAPYSDEAFTPSAKDFQQELNRIEGVVSEGNAVAVLLDSNIRGSREATDEKKLVFILLCTTMREERGCTMG